MIIYHLDRNAHGWRFNIPDCSKAQAGAFARCLRAISNISVRRRGPNGWRRSPTEKANAEFCERIERELLALIAEKYGATEADYNSNDYFAL